MQRAPETCPNCGADVPPNASTCPECGSDAQTGWADDAYAGSLGISEEKFDYDDYVQREFGGKSEHRPRGVSKLWWIVALLLLAAFVMVWVL